MTWLTNCVTVVQCDDPKHTGDPIFSVQTSFALTAREALRKRGWGYDHGKKYHVCPDCVTRNIKAGRARLN